MSANRNWLSRVNERDENKIKEIFGTDLLHVVEKIKRREAEYKDMEAHHVRQSWPPKPCMKYVFSDWNDEKKEEHAISGEDYRQLVTVCGGQAASFSLVFTERQMQRQDPVYQELFCLCLKKEAYYNDTERCFFPCTEFTLNFLCTEVSDLFDWIYTWGSDNPEDLAFYRADGTPIMQSSALEGFCWLNPMEAEEPAFQQILANDGWELSKKDD